MPIQTPKKNYIYFPDGAKVSVKQPGGAYFDVGAINSVVQNSLTWEENEVDTSNAGELDKQYRNMAMEGSFTLINLDPEGVEKLGAGIFTRSVTTGSPDTTVVPQTIVAGTYSAKTLISLDLVNSAGVSLKASAVPTIASVVSADDGPLAEGTDYEILADSNSASGYSIMVKTGGALSNVNQDIVVTYTSVTPIASTTITAGKSTGLFTAYAMKIEHTDDNGKVRTLELFAVDSNSGGFQFNYKGANEDGTEEMPLTYKAKLDTTRTNGAQLFQWTVQQGAQ